MNPFRAIPRLRADLAEARAKLARVQAERDAAIAEIARRDAQRARNRRNGAGPEYRARVRATLAQMQAAGL